MCDTFYVDKSRTRDGVALFGKNSDREPNEAQLLAHYPASESEGGERACTYASVPDPGPRHALLLSRPYWMWGAEMGANERGLVIGNEAVFTKVPRSSDSTRLTGMDLLRLALERAGTADAALSVITDLLARYGQGGNCGLGRPFYYDNSFLLADPDGAIVLETAGPHWVARRVRDGVGVISNRLSIGSDFDWISADAKAYARARGWWSGRGAFNFARAYTAKLYSHFGDGARRSATLRDRLCGGASVDVMAAMAALRDHGPSDGPHAGWTGARVCMHAGPGPIRRFQTTASWVSHLAPGAVTHFATGTAAPCLSLFKPMWVDAPPEHLGAPTQQCDEESLYWRHERFHRAALADHRGAHALVQPVQAKEEAEWVRCALAAASGPAADRRSLVAACFAAADAHLEVWHRAVAREETRDRRGWAMRRTWAGLNRAAGMAAALPSAPKAGQPVSGATG